MEPLIRVKNMYKIYNPGENEVRALDDVSLEINQGEFIAIVGHSGSGKSTFMNMLGCLDTPDSGEYFLDGKDVANLSDNELSDIRNHKIGFIFQGFNLIPNLDALGNVELPLIYRGLGKQQRKEIAGEALSKVGLENRMDHRPNQLSGGQQQRVGIARAYCNEPLVMLLDEPFGHRSGVYLRHLPSPRTSGLHQPPHPGGQAGRVDEAVSQKGKGQLRQYAGASQRRPCP